MDQSFKAETINALTKLLMDHYVFPETAANMSHDVTGRLNNNEYASINDFSLFAEIVTAQLQGICRDKHLQMRHRTKEPQAEKTEEDRKVDEDHYLTMLKLDNLDSPKSSGYREILGCWNFKLLHRLSMPAKRHLVQ